jgi:hypothetical protein
MKKQVLRVKDFFEVHHKFSGFLSVVALFVALSMIFLFNVKSRSGKVELSLVYLFWMGLQQTFHKLSCAGIRRTVMLEIRRGLLIKMRAQVNDMFPDILPKTQ